MPSKKKAIVILDTSIAELNIQLENVLKTELEKKSG